MKLSRRNFLKAVSLGSVTLLTPVFSSVDRKSDVNRKPNVLFIVVDDLRPQLGCYGHKQMISPNIDRLAAQGVLFERAYCQYPVCGPSRCSVLTGLRPTQKRFKDNNAFVDREVPNVPTLPRHFKNNGYYTISNGKVFHDHGNVIDGMDSWSEIPWAPHPGFYVWRTKAYQHHTYQFNNKGPAYEAADIPDNGYPTGIITDKTISDLQRLKRMDKPFFLAVGYRKPHLPFNAPKRYWDLYKRQEIDLADNPFKPRGAPDAAMHNWDELRSYLGIPKEGPLSDDLARVCIHGYYACVSYTDAQIGRILDELDDLGLRDATVVMLWGDHGWQLGEHSLWCKNCNFHTSLHSPLIVNAPGVTGDKKTIGLTEFVDMYPSLCELCGLSTPRHLEGVSFVPLMKNPGRPWKKAVFARCKGAETIRTDRYCYTEWRKKGQVYARMLYDHQTDPYENVNIAELLENKKLVERLSDMLHKGWKNALP